MAVEPDVGLRRHAGFRRADGGALQDVDLRLDDVDAGDLLGDRVLDLDARIDLDEVEFAGIGIHQELDRAGADIAGRLGDLQRVAAQLVALGVVEIGRRRALDDLLVAPLDRAVALEQMDGVAVGVAEHLHLDMAGALDQLFEIDLVLAEGGLGLALGLRHLAAEIGLGADGAHAAAATAPGGLQHHRIADSAGHLRPPRPCRRAAARSPAPPARRFPCARLRAATLLPSRRIVSGLGPMKMMPASAQASANSGLSDNSP